MEINRQLFEDVLSGKLKGIFVLKNGDKYDTSNLNRNTNKRTSHNYPYTLYNGNYVFICYTAHGKNGRIVKEYEHDIIDFIPDTDMKENELTIEIPDGKIVDWDESKKQNKVVLKDKQLTYEEICNVLFEGGHYYINGIGNIEYSYNNPYFANTASSKHQLECILAKNKLATVAVYLNNGWKPSKDDHFFTITYYDDSRDKLIISEHYFGTRENLVLFQTQKVAKQAIEILGEETVKLALEPLGI